MWSNFFFFVFCFLFFVFCVGTFRLIFNFANCIDRFSSLSRESKLLLQKFFSSQKTPDDLIPFAQSLPIFGNYSGEFSTVTSYVSPSADQVHPDLLCGLPKFMDIPPESVPFARLLGAKDIPILSFYTSFVFSRLKSLSVSVRDDAMLRLLRMLHDIHDRKFLSQLAFIPSPSGSQNTSAPYVSFY